jgi:hypothetical protein
MANTIQEVALDHQRGRYFSELIVAVQYGSLGWRRNLAGGQFAPAVWFPISVVESDHDRIAVEELDGDREVASVSGIGGFLLLVMENDGAGTLSPVPSLSASFSVSVSGFSGFPVDALDPTGDGTPEIAAHPAAGNESVTAVLQGLPGSVA